MLNLFIDNEIELKGMLALIYYFHVVKYVHTVETIRLEFLVIKILFPYFSLVSSK